MEHLTDTLVGMAGLGLLFALTAWLPLKGEGGGCGSCGGSCATCPGEGCAPGGGDAPERPAPCPPPARPPSP